MLAETFNIDQTPARNRVMTTLVIFIPAIAILVFAKMNAGGFNLLWRYFGFTNQLVAVFALAMSTVYLMVHNKNFLLTFVPMLFYTFIVTSYISHASIGFQLDNLILGQPESYTVSYIVGAVVTALVAFVVYRYGQKNKAKIVKLEPVPIYN